MDVIQPIEHLAHLAVGLRVEGGAAALRHQCQQSEPGLFIDLGQSFECGFDLMGDLPVFAKKVLKPSDQHLADLLFHLVCHCLPLEAFQLSQVEPESICRA